MDYIFYDTETTGISTYYDQILQFAAIRTDENFNELERFDIRCRLQDHIVASPQAMQITRVTAADLINPDFPTHYEMIKTIREKLLSWQPAIIMGQNTLGFDEPMLRSDFYQNLFPAYLTNTNGNIRMDSLPIMRAVSILAPDALIFPLNDKGNKSFKLDLVAPANGCEHQNAHEAISDVEATIFVCGLIKQRAPKIWDNFRKHADKFKVLGFTKRNYPYALIRPIFGKMTVTPVATLGVNPNNANEVFVLNLTHDPAKLTEMDDEKFVAFFKRSPKPVLSLRANAMPSVWSLVDFPELTEHIPFDDDLVLSRAAKLADVHGLKKRVLDLYLGGKEPFEDSPHVERQIYSGFAPRRDENIMAAFHKLEWKDRWSLVQSISDQRLSLIHI